MAVVDLAQERLLRAMVDTAVTAGSDDCQKFSEKVEGLNKVLAVTDKETKALVLGSDSPTVAEVIDTALALLRAAGDLGRLIERIRR